MAIDYREDGWPYCPRCGEDELWTTANSPKLSDHFEKEFHCYRCGWNGRLEDRELVEYEEVVDLSFESRLQRAYTVDGRAFEHRWREFGGDMPDYDYGWHRTPEHDKSEQ